LKSDANTIASVKFPLKTATLLVRAKGSSIVAGLRNLPAVSVTDTSYSSSGYIELYARSDAYSGTAPVVKFSNLRIRKL
jgi:hypothetical protein